MKKHLISIFIVSAFLTGCMEVPELISTTQKDLVVTITQINPPKHVVIDMVDADGNTYQHRSKHCNIFREYQIGKKYKITLTESLYKTKSGSHKSTSLSICGNNPVIPL